MNEKPSHTSAKVVIPVQAIGRSVDGIVFQQLTQSQDASAFNISIILQDTVELGSILLLAMRLPRRLRLFDLNKDIYQVYASVQKAQMMMGGTYEVSLAFVGKTPPAGHEEFKDIEIFVPQLETPAPVLATPELPKVPEPIVASAPDEEELNLMPELSIVHTPANAVTNEVTSSLTATDAVSPATTVTPESRPIDPLNPLERKLVRRHTRFHIPIEAQVEFLDATGKVLVREPGLVTNISRSGACIMATREAQLGSRVKVIMARENFTAQSCIKAVTTGQGGIWNLHVEFLDNCWMGGTQ